MIGPQGLKVGGRELDRNNTVHGDLSTTGPKEKLHFKAEVRSFLMKGRGRER